jgi:hypothetical protein
MKAHSEVGALRPLAGARSNEDQRVDVEKSGTNFPWFRDLLRAAMLAAGLLVAIAAAPKRAAAMTPAEFGSHFEALGHVGWIGILDREALNSFASVELRLRDGWHGLRPWAGLTLVDSGAWFSGAGAIFTIDLPRNVQLTLGSGPFYYNHGRGDDLGFDLEFYSFAEVSIATRHAARVGLRIGHLSNAGLGRRNPGTETLSFVATIPLGRRR